MSTEALLGGDPVLAECEFLGQQYDQLLDRALEVRALYAIFETLRYGKPWGRANRLTGSLYNAGGLAMWYERGNKAETEEEIGDSLWSQLLITDEYLRYNPSEHTPEEEDELNNARWSLRENFIDTTRGIHAGLQDNEPRDVLHLFGLHAAYATQASRFAQGLDGVRKVHNARNQFIEALAYTQHYLLRGADMYGLDIGSTFYAGMNALEVRVRMQIAEEQLQKGLLTQAGRDGAILAARTLGTQYGFDDQTLDEIYLKAMKT